jgi:hypothetical protein
MVTTVDVLSQQVRPGYGWLAKVFLQADLPLAVWRSRAGYYIGTRWNEAAPASRESQEYFLTRELAQDALDRGEWTQRYTA